PYSGGQGCAPRIRSPRPWPKRSRTTATITRTRASNSAWRSSGSRATTSRSEPHGRIAELARVSRSTVQRTLRIYAAKGLDGVRSFGWKGQPGALAPHAATIEAAVRAHPAHTGHEAD